MFFGEDWLQPTLRFFRSNGFWEGLDWRGFGQGSESEWKMDVKGEEGVVRGGSKVELDRGACLGFEGEGVLNIWFLL